MQSAHAAIIALDGRVERNLIRSPKTAAKNSPPAGLTRESTSLSTGAKKKDVDDRVKPGQGDKGGRWDDYFLNGPHVSDDFMTERDDPPAEEREPL
jgi:hypothetical protein